MENLIKIQAELKAPKCQTNKFGNYKYRSCEDILEAVKPLLLKIIPLAEILMSMQFPILMFLNPEMFRRN